MFVNLNVTGYIKVGSLHSLKFDNLSQKKLTKCIKYTKILIYKNSFMQTYSIPIRFSYEEKYILEQEARNLNMPLSTFIRSKIQQSIAPKLAGINKASILIAKLKQNKVSDKNITKADKVGKNFRKNFKVSN